MKGQKFESSEKIVQRMTRDGLVEENLATGSKSNVSNQLKDADFAKNKERMSFKEQKGPLETKRKSTRRLNYKDENSKDLERDFQKEENPTNNTDHLNKFNVQNESNQPENKESTSNEVANKPDNKFEKSNDFQKAKQKKAQYRKQHVQNKVIPVKEEAPKATKLQFNKSEIAEPIPEGISRTKADTSKRMVTLERKAVRTQKQIEHAKKRIPKRHSLKIERYFDEEKGRARKQIFFEASGKLVKTDGIGKQRIKQFRRQSFNYAHRKVSEVEKENSSVEATHKGEQAVEGVLQHKRNNVLKKRQRLQGKARKLEQRSNKIYAQNQYQKFKVENPDKLKSTLRKKFIQKQRIKKEYQKVYKNGKSGVVVTNKTLDATTKIAKKLIEMMIRFRSAILISAAIGLLMIIIAAGISSCSAMFTNSVSTMIYCSWNSDPVEIDKVDMAFTYMEAELENSINHIELDHPGYDEYRYNLGAIGHNPFELIAYLSSLYEVFTLDMVLGELESLFSAMYTFTITEIIEIRTRTETQTVYYINPDTGEITEEQVEVEVEYEYHILDIQLATVPLSNIVAIRLNEEQLNLYAAYMDTKGGLQQLGSPFNVNWYPYISSYYGYRIGPTSGELQLHRGLDIAMPEGTEIQAAHSGTVITVNFDSIYGNFVIITDDLGFTAKYAHLLHVGVSEGQSVTIGDVIGEVGTTGNSTGNHLHIEVLYNDYYFNPLFYLNVGTGSL